MPIFITYNLLYLFSINFFAFNAMIFIIIIIKTFFPNKIKILINH